MFGVACYHCPSKTHTIGQHAARHVRMELRQHTWLDDIRHRMQSSPLGCTSGWITSVLEFHHRPWETYTVELRQAWHAVMNLGQHTRSETVRHDMPLSPLDSIHGQKNLGMECYLRPKTAHMVRQCWAWKCYHLPLEAHTVGWRQALNAIIALWTTHTIG